MNKEGQKVRRIPAEGIDNSQNDEMFPPVKGGIFIASYLRKFYCSFIDNIPTGVYNGGRIKSMS